MIFGISVSDIYGCARLAYRLYEELKQAPGACRTFALELRSFHEVLMNVTSTIKSKASHLDHSNQAALSACLDSCKELLCKQILGVQEMPADLGELDFGLYHSLIDMSEYKGYRAPSHGDAGPFKTWLQRFRKRTLALQIPKLQRAISAHIEKLNIFLALSNRRDNQDSQERIETRVVESHDVLVKSSKNHALRLDSIIDRLDTSHDILAQSSTNHTLQLDSVSQRLDTSQARIESQLQAILANQQRSKTPILSQTLDASSPEGRQTWMELGRLLRDEGITPAMIENNRGLLIDAMKNTLRNETLLPESASESYATAPEHHTDSMIPSSGFRQRDLSYAGYSSTLSPMSILGSAPPRCSGFTDAFLARQNGAASCLDKSQNVNDGMQSLLQGMNSGDLTEDWEPCDSDCFESGYMELEQDPAQCNEDRATVEGS